MEPENLLPSSQDESNPHLLPYLPKIRFNIIPQSTVRPSEWSFTLRLSNKNLRNFSPFAKTLFLTTKQVQLLRN
jgi:hypothetical protein